MDFRSSIVFFIIFITTFLSLVYGSRNFNVIFDDIKCSENPKNAYPPTCYVNKTSNTAFMSIQVNRVVPKFEYAIDIYLVRNKNERYPILQLIRNEGCSFFEGKIRMFLERSAREMLTDSGKLPKKCPIEKDFHFLFKEFRVNADKLPPLFPEGDYEIRFNATMAKRKDLIVTLSSKIRIIPKPKKT